MLRSLLIGFVGGMRSMTPVAAVALAAREGTLPTGNGAQEFLAHPVVSAVAVPLAAGELLGDKMPSAPDRIIAPGLAARAVTGALAGAALAPREQRWAASLVGGAAAIASAYLTFAARTTAMRRYGQVPTGLIEDAIALGATALIVNGAKAGAIPAQAEHGF